MKRIISLMLTLAVTLSLLVLLAGAASTPEEALGEVNIYSGGYSMNYLAVNGRVQTQSYTYFLYRNSVGETQEILAYCVTPDQYGVPQTVPEGESIRYLAEEQASDSKVVGLVANMSPHRSLAELGRYLLSLLRPGWTDRLLMYRSRMGRTYRRAPVLWMRTTRILPRSRSPIPETATRGPSRCSTQRTA